MLKSIFSKSAIAALLLAPVLASAATTSSVTFADTADKDVKIDGSGFAIANVRWTDPTFRISKGVTQEFQASSLVWNLFKGNSIVKSGSFADAVGDSNSGQIVINESGLTKGEYKLVFTGKWTVPGASDSWKELREEKVAFSNITYSSVSPVPEPETYAMLLVGLGVMGAIAVRRRKSDAS